MSASLAYEPVIPKEPNTLGDKLKQVLILKYDLRNGSHRLESGDIPYLSGLMDAGIDDAKELIDCVKQYGKVDLFLVY